MWRNSLQVVVLQQPLLFSPSTLGGRGAPYLVQSATTFPDPDATLFTLGLPR
jgi:hypothetical protein